MGRLRERYGRYPPEPLADGAYTNLDSVVEIEERGVDYFSNWTGRNREPSGHGAEQHRDYRLDRFDFDDETNQMI